jgi:hypothetical protein
VQRAQFNITLHGITLTCRQYTQKVPQQNMQNMETAFLNTNTTISKLIITTKEGITSNTKNYTLPSSTPGTIFQCHKCHENKNLKNKNVDQYTPFLQLKNAVQKQMKQILIGHKLYIMILSLNIFKLSKIRNNLNTKIISYNTTTYVKICLKYKKCKLH